MLKKRAVYSAAVVAALACVGSSANAATLLYNDTSQTGNGTYPGTLVETFTVSQGNLVVSDLAAFDSGKNGITGHVMVGLYDDTAGSVAIAAVDFHGAAYNGTGGSYFDTMALPSAYALISGHTYSIEAWGFTATDNDYFLQNGGAVSFNPSTYALTNVPGTTGASGNAATNIDGNTTGGLFNALFGNTTAYSTYSPYATNPCFGVSNCTNDGLILRFNGTDASAAGSLVINETPLPAALPLFASGLGALGLLGWRRKRKAALAV
jgi:hypothetical protein